MAKDFKKFGLWQTPDGTVWQVGSNQRKGITSAQALKDYGWEKTKIQQATFEEMDALKIVGYLNEGAKETKEPPDKKIPVKEVTKEPKPAEPTIQPLPKGDFTKPFAGLFQDETGTVWQVGSGRKKGITSLEALQDWFPDEQIKQSTQEELGKLETVGYLNIGKTESSLPPEDPSKPFTGEKFTPFQYTEESRATAEQQLAQLEYSPIESENLENVYQRRPDLKNFFDEEGKAKPESGLGEMSLVAWAMRYGFNELPEILGKYDPSLVIAQRFQDFVGRAPEQEELMPLVEKFTKGELKSIDNIDTAIQKTDAFTNLTDLQKANNIILSRLPGEGEKYKDFAFNEAEAMEIAKADIQKYYSEKQTQAEEEAGIATGRVKEDYLRSKNFAEAQRESELASQADFLKQQAEIFKQQVYNQRKAFGAGAFGGAPEEKERKMKESQAYTGREQQRSFAEAGRTFEYNAESARLLKERGIEDMSRKLKQFSTELGREKEFEATQKVEDIYQKRKLEYDIEKQTFEETNLPYKSLTGGQIGTQYFKLGLK